MDDRDRTAPVALARDAPVAQAEVDLALGDGTILPLPARGERVGVRGRTRCLRMVGKAPHRIALAALGRSTTPRGRGEVSVLQPPRHLLLRFRGGHAVEEARIDHAAVAVIGRVGDDEGLGVLPGRAHDRDVAESVFVDEVEVALVVRRAAEDGAGAVVHEDEIGDVDRQLPRRVERVQRRDAGVEPHLLGGIDLGLCGAAVPAFLDELGELRILLCRRGGERMIRRERHEFRAEQRVRPRGEDLEFALAGGRRLRIEREADQQPLGAADPILLHQPHFLRPAVELVERVEQLLRIVGDLEEPLRQLALLDHGAGAPAAAVDHLLVRQHRLVDRIPVHLRLAPLDQAGAQEIEEHRLLVLVVGRVAGRDLAAPVERQPHRFQLRLHRRDVLVGPPFGMDLALHGGVLRRHAKGVPAHRMQHGKALRPLHPRHHVAHRVVAHVAHVDAPRRIGEHLQHVVFRPLVVVAGAEDAALVPDLLPARLGLGGVVAVVRHRQSQSSFGSAGARRRCLRVTSVESRLDAGI